MPHIEPRFSHPIMSMPGCNVVERLVYFDLVTFHDSPIPSAWSFALVWGDDRGQEYCAPWYAVDSFASIEDAVDDAMVCIAEESISVPPNCDVKTAMRIMYCKLFG